MVFTGFLPHCLGVLLVWHFYFYIRRQFFSRTRFLFNSILCNAFQNIKFEDDEHFVLTLFSFYPSMIIIAKDRTQVLTSFNCLRNRELHFVNDAMCT